MVRERDDWGYYVRAIRDLTHPPSWRWSIIRRGNPMGILLEAGGFSTYEAARFAGNVALADFIERLERGGTRIPAQTRVADQKPLACSAFLSSHGGRVGALWTITVDHSSRRGIAGTPTPWAARAWAGHETPSCRSW
jgi:hypothetical protein